MFFDIVEFYFNIGQIIMVSADYISVFSYGYNIDKL